MRRIQLLDCTLRDGGYLNDWEFGHSHLISLPERSVASGVDIVELGFLDDRRPFDENRCIMPNTSCMTQMYGRIDKKESMFVAMIDYGTCDISNLQPCEETCLDGIRVIFKKHLMHEAMEYCAEVKKLGYKVFSQLVSITSFTDDDLMELIELVNEVKPYAVSMVDTYGLMNPRRIKHYFPILDKYVDDSVGIGFHAHNNFQLGFANAMTFMEMPGHHDLVVDGSIYGMGKSAGNAPLELLMMELNQNYGKQYRIGPILEAIDESILGFQQRYRWGYQEYFYLCGVNECHPNYVGQFQKKENITSSKLYELLGMIEPHDTKLLYNRGAGEEIYEQYLGQITQDKDCYKQLKHTLQGKKILVIGPGKNIQLQAERVANYIESEKPVIISINYVPGAYRVDYVFVTNIHRYQQMADALLECKNRDIKIIATSNVEARAEQFEYQLERVPLLEKQERIKDNSFLMLLKVLQKVGVSSVACAGLDGYSEKEDNYFNPKMEYSFIKEEATHLNRYIREFIQEHFEDMEIEFITYSRYTEEEDCNLAGF